MNVYILSVELIFSYSISLIISFGSMGFDVVVVVVLR